MSVGRVECFVCPRITETVSFNQCKISRRKRKHDPLKEYQKPKSLKLNEISKKENAPFFLWHLSLNSLERRENVNNDPVPFLTLIKTLYKN